MNIMEFINNVTSILSLIVILGSAVAAISALIAKFSKPFKKRRQKLEEEKQKRDVQRIDDELLKILPDILKKHEVEVEARTKILREQELESLKLQVVKHFNEKLEAVNDLQANMEIMIKSGKDVLREKIMAIYHKRKKQRALQQHEKEALTEWYKDYKAMNGNSYIDKYFQRMEDWLVIPDNYDNED